MTERKRDEYLFEEIGPRTCWFGLLKITFLRNNLK